MPLKEKILTYISKYISTSHKDDYGQHYLPSGIFFATLGRGPKAFQIGKTSAVNP